VKNEKNKWARRNTGPFNQTKKDTKCTILITKKKRSAKSLQGV